MSLRDDPCFDDYLEKSAAFARPILAHLRGLVHEVCPDARETMKWSRPAFTYKGKILCILGAFKEHCAFNLWHSAVVVEAARELGKSEEASGQFGRLTCLADLPPDATLRRYLAAAMEIAESGEPAFPAREAAQPRKPELPVPDDLAALLARQPVAAKIFAAFPPGHRREYLAWIADAKRPETRARRLATTVDWLNEGKGFGWKYQAARG